LTEPSPSLEFNVLFDESSFIFDGLPSTTFFDVFSDASTPISEGLSTTTTLLGEAD
jgi:hypothetical protein